MSTPMQREEVFDPVRRRHVALTPEEGVRQGVIRLLHEHYGYPLELMQIEGSISVGGLNRRCDIVVYTPQGSPHIIVECKRPDVAITQQVCDQACRYNTVLHVPFLMLTNGTQQVILEVDFDRRRLRQLPALPPYQPPVARRGAALALCLILLFSFSFPVWAQNKKSIPLFDQAAECSSVGQYEKAVQLLNKAVDVDPGYVEAYLLLGVQHMSLGNYTEARRHYQRALDLKPTLRLWREEAEKGIRTAEWRQNAVTHPVPFTPINLGPNVNSADDEYMPALTADYRTLVFTRRVPRRATTRHDLPMEEDFFCSLYDTMELNWGAASRMPEPLNSNANEGAQTLSHDGRVVIFTACGRSNEPTGCDLYMSVFHGGKWGEPRNLGAPANSVYWESFPSLSIDGRTLYFASNRRGGYGGTDIWCCTLEEGRWGEPRNLGPTVNTPGNETSPYIHFDDRTLYFSSDGHMGMGGADLYLVRRTSDTTWGEPQNLGFPINTPGDESSLIVAPDGRTAIFASDAEGGYGKLDLYSFVLPAPIRPERVTFVDPVRQAETLLTLGDTVTLPGIFFETAKATLMERSLAELDRLAEALMRHPALRLEVGGHTDAVGSDEANMLLSEQRAKAVYDYLLSRGIAADRLTYRGYGETRPVADNQTAEGRAANRRTTLTPLK